MGRGVAPKLMRSRLLLLVAGAAGFQTHLRRTPPQIPRCRRLFSGEDPERQRILDEAKRILERAQAPDDDPGREGRGIATGALIGGVFGGPLGMMLGASLGGNVGAAAGANLAAKKRMRELGVDDDILTQIGAAAKDLDEATESRGYVESAFLSGGSFARTLERDRDAAQAAAEGAVKGGDDDAARRYIKARIALDKRVSVAAAEADDAQRRLKNLDADIAILRTRCDDLDFLLARRVVATARGDADVSPFDVADDALMDRFRKLEDK